MINKVPLTLLQKKIMYEFYSKGKHKVIFNKNERDKIWKSAKAKKQIDKIENIKIRCPALYHQIIKSYENDMNIQSAVFSECVYAQTFANMFDLNIFTNCLENPDFIPTSINALLTSYHLYPRYCYSNYDKSRVLIQAGGCNGIDSALITVIDLVIYTIEFKEPAAKTSEPDLPKYKEDGKLLTTKEFEEKYPQFKQMLYEKQGLNFFDVMGQNINEFTYESINIAVTNNYAKKYADVVCTEDINGYLVMLPINQISLWAKIEGEIRPAGRNHYKAWTPNALRKFIIENGGIIEDYSVQIDADKMIPRKERGGAGKISGYKINPLFFVYKKDCTKKENKIFFDIKNVQQLNPTIAGKMFFEKLKYDEVKNYYFPNV